MRKTYVLTDDFRPSLEAFIQVSKDTRIYLDTLPLWKPFLQVTAYYRKQGKNRTLRLKLNSNTPWQDEQIKEEGIPANAPFTTAERSAANFVNMICETDNENVQNFLENYPGFEGFDGTCADVPKICYRLYDQEKVIDRENDDYMRMLEAGMKIKGLSLTEAQDLLIRIYGVSYTPPTELKLAQNTLYAFMNTGGEPALEAIMKRDTNLDDATTVLIGRLKSAGLLSFDVVPGQVAKKTIDGKWLNIKAIPNEYSEDERVRYFTQFITGPDGRLLLQDMKTALEEFTRPAAAVVADRAPVNVDPQKREAQTGLPVNDISDFGEGPTLTPQTLTAPAQVSSGGLPPNDAANDFPDTPPPFVPIKDRPVAKPPVVKKPGATTATTRRGN